MEDLNPTPVVINQEKVDPESNTARRKFNLPIALVVIVSVVLLVISNAVNYLWQSGIVAQKDQQIEDLTKTLENFETDLTNARAELEETKNSLELIMNPPEPSYCENGETYDNLSYKYKVCIPDGWAKDSSNSEIVLIKKVGQEDSNVITVTFSEDFIEDALDKYTKDVFVDDANRNLKVDGVDAIQVSGTVKPDSKRAITVFTMNATTYEISLDNNEDATYTGNLEDYKKIVDSFRFLTK